jgi:hypothetical protein
MDNLKDRYHFNVNGCCVDFCEGGNILYWQGSCFVVRTAFLDVINYGDETLEQL